MKYYLAMVKRTCPQKHNNLRLGEARLDVFGEGLTTVWCRGGDPDIKHVSTSMLTSVIYALYLRATASLVQTLSLPPCL